ncbi:MULTISPECIES: hypothetical protein [Bradyrhizobium]|nr:MULTISPECIES: hypothetical protein [Bradyrhizobium]
MTIRSRRETVTFRHPFRRHRIDRVLPADLANAQAADASIAND